MDMRNKEKEIKDRSAIDAVIRSCRVCRLGLSDDGEPYVVPLCFGYDGESIYFHCAKEGRKLDILRKNNRVCVEFDVVREMVEAEEACLWGISYQSVIGVGTAEVVEDPEGKRHGLAVLMSQYSDKAYEFPETAVQGTCVVRMKLERLTGKQSFE